MYAHAHGDAPHELWLHAVVHEVLRRVLAPPTLRCTLCRTLLLTRRRQRRRRLSSSSSSSSYYLVFCLFACWRLNLTRHVAHCCYRHHAASAVALPMPRCQHSAVSHLFFCAVAAAAAAAAGLAAASTEFDSSSSSSLPS
mmetsp:Transcript_8493/g.15561  ORF Transcript_8493/g.15561 Transcript_8493/m.15561 type:complete len:140 (+) Transcript_8493:642-1061(+)